MILDPELESKMSFKDFYFVNISVYKTFLNQALHNNKQTYSELNLSRENSLFTNSPRIIDADSDAGRLINFIKDRQNFRPNRGVEDNTCHQIYYVRKKRLHYELENINDNLFMQSLCYKKFKYSKESSAIQRSVSN